MSEAFRPAIVSVCATAVFILLSVAPGAWASDGVLEISAACAAVGCFSGDAPGLPVTIDGSAGTSYRLLRELTLPSADTTGISAASDSISAASGSPAR